MRKLLIGLGVVVVVLVGVAFAGPLLVPTDSIKSDITAEVRKATGRDLTIDGRLSFRILPSPGVSVGEVTLSNPEGRGSQGMVQVADAAVDVALLPLLSGNVQVTRIVLREPEILLEQYADGSNNWTFEPETGQAPSDETESSASQSAGTSGAPAVRFDNVVVENGTVTYRTPESLERIENIDMVLGAESLAGPFAAEGSLAARGFDITMGATIGELVADKATPINLRVETAGARVLYNGFLSGATGTPRVSGQVEVRADDLSRLVASVTDDPQPALRGKALELDGTVTATQTAINLDDLALRLGDDSATGAADVSLGEDLSANLVLNMTQLDLDRLLSETAPADTGTNSTASSTAGEKAAGETNPTTASAGFVIPTNISASLEANIDAVIYREGVIRQVVLNAELAQGALNISRASAQLPGGTSASLVGLVTSADSGAEFNGQAEVASDNLRSLLQWAGADVSAVPAERLRKMTGSVNIAARPDSATLTDIDVSVDVSRLRGGVAIALRERPGLGIGLSLDKLNVDAYLPDRNAVASAADPSPQPAVRSGETAPVPAQAGDELAVLNAFDANLQLKVGELVYRDQRVRGINVDGTLQAGVLDLRDASISNLEGAKLAAKGRVDGLSDTPQANLTIDIDAPDADRLLALADITPPAPIGPGKLNGTFRGDLENLSVDTTVQALGANLKAVGTVGALAAPPRYDLTFDLKHADASAFFGRLAGDRSAAGVKTGPLAAVVTARGNLNASNLAANVDVGPGKIVLDGKFDNLASGAPTGSLALDVSHPDMVAFVRTFANDYKPALADAGPFALNTTLNLQPDLLTMPKMEGQAGPVSYAGNARVGLGGDRPDITAELNTSEIIVDWFLPVQSSGGASSSGSGTTSSGAGGAAPAKGEGSARWSRERLDLSALQSANADLKLSAPAITYTDIKVDQPQLALTLQNGVLDLNQLSGNAFGGAFNMTAQMADREVPTMRYALKVEGTDAAKFLGGASAGSNKGAASALELLFPVSNISLVSGTLGADLNVSARGRSEFELISNLGGEGAVQFSNAVINGVDLCRISNQLDNLNGLEGFLGLAASAQGGQSKIANFDGRFSIANGVATFPQQQLNPDCAAVSFSGTTDLPQWLIDLQARAGFPAHPEFPGIVVEQKGSLDAPNTRLVNVNQINEFVAGKAVGTALRKLLPGATQQPQQPSSGDSSAPAENQAPADPFKNLLEGLIKRR